MEICGIQGHWPRKLADNISRGRRIADPRPPFPGQKASGGSADIYARRARRVLLIAVTGDLCLLCGPAFAGLGSIGRRNSPRYRRLITRDKIRLEIERRLRRWISLSQVSGTQDCEARDDIGIR